MKSKHIIVPVALVSILSFVIYGFTGKTSVPHSAASATPVLIMADSLDLAKHKGKVIVLSFWASWSKISRSENKHLVRVFQKYKTNPKIVFISVSLDTDQTSWKTAIEEDGLTWTEHVCDFKKYESPVALKFNVNTLPKIILLDSKGHISQSSAKMIDIENHIDALLK